MSARAERFRSWTMVVASMSPRKKALPGLTTDAAWVRRPIRDSRSLFFPVPRGVGSSACFIHWLIVVSKWSSLSCGRRTWPATESISMPKKVRVVAVPSVFSRATGNSSSLHSVSVVCSAWPQSGEPAGPRMRKSSR